MIDTVPHSVTSSDNHCLTQCDVQCNKNWYYAVTHVHPRINKDGVRIASKLPFYCIKCVEIVVMNPYKNSNDTVFMHPLLQNVVLGSHACSIQYSEA